MKNITVLFNECFEYVKRNKFKTILVILSMTLGYGFYVSSYTLNIDDEFTDFWNGGRLVAAGRFTGYLIQLITGIMTYSPFFTMLFGLIIFFLAGLVFSMVLYFASEKKLSDNALFVFWIVFVTFPIISEQMVYPIIVLLGLGYFMTAVSLYLVDIFYKEKSISVLVVSIVMMILYIDFYEAFVTVYLTLMMGIVLVKYIYSSNGEDRKFGKILLYMIKTVAIMLVAIAIRMVIAKVIIYIFYGTTKAGYSGNNSIAWTQLGIVDCAIWLIRTVFLKYFWAAVDYLPIFIFVASAICGLILTIILSVKHKSVLPVLAFLFMIAGALSLNVLVGLATGYTMAQSLAVFVAFTVMFLYSMVQDKKIGKAIVSICICLLVLNQTKSLNEWSVTNYKRYDYEATIVDNIGYDLASSYPIDQKTVIFIGGEDAPQLPDYFQDSCETENPAVNAVQNIFIKMSDKIIPKQYFIKIGDFYGTDCNNATDLYNMVKKSRNVSTASSSYLSWSMGGESWFNPYDSSVGYCDTTYNFFEKRGYELIRCTKEEYNEVCNDYAKYPSYPSNGYITETDKYIIVNFGE